MESSSIRVGILLVLAFFDSPIASLPTGSANSNSASSVTEEDIELAREALMSDEQKMRTSFKANLTAKEQIVDNMLVADKRMRIEASRTEGAYFPMNFLTSRMEMEDTTSFQIIQKMPKGGLLHMHKSAMVNLDWVVTNLTYRPHLYMCVDEDQGVRFKFSDSPPEAQDCNNWDLLSNYRDNACSAEDFDKTLYENLTLVRPDPAKAYPDINTVWDVFEGYFSRMGNLIYYAPVWRDYLWQALTEFLEDKVQYVEIRGSAPKLYELNGTVHDREWAIDNVYIPVFQEFKEKHPSFIGAKLIISGFRGVSKEKMMGYVQKATTLYQNYPGLVVGFDIVGQEDRYNPLSEYMEAFLYPSQLDPPVHLPYFFHAGETVWQETATDYNLIDALLLNTTRIGHGYALVKHPLLMEMVEERGIALEVCPISNQVLKLVEDLRNHPAAVYLAKDVPMVVTSDDPAIWDALPLSHDFYLTFMTMLGEDAGLASLKQLALNSIKYSAMNEAEKDEAEDKWKTEWDKFIEDLQPADSAAPAA